jgi:uncharacterized membrane protein
MTFIKELLAMFGDKTKWVLLGLVGFVVIIAIILLIFTLIYWKWILLGCGIALVLAIVGLIVYKKIKDAKTAKTTEAVKPA